MGKNDKVVGFGKKGESLVLFILYFEIFIRYKWRNGMVENGIEFWVRDINLKVIDMFKVFKVRGLEEIIEEKRGDSRIKYRDIVIFWDSDYEKDLKILRRCG